MTGKQYVKKEKKTLTVQFVKKNKKKTDKKIKRVELVNKIPTQRSFCTAYTSKKTNQVQKD